MLMQCCNGKMCKVLLIDIIDNRLNVPDQILYHTQYVRFLTNMDFSGIVFRYFKPLFYLHNGALFCVFSPFKEAFEHLYYIIHPKESKRNWFLKTFVLQTLC